MLYSQILLTSRTPKQRIDILKRHVRSFRNPIRRPEVRSETRRREDQERKPSSLSQLPVIQIVVTGNSRWRGGEEGRGSQPDQN